MSEAAEAPKSVRLNVKPKTLLAIVGGGLMLGAFIVLGWILPAEYNSDPIGVGKLTGVSRIWAPPERKFDLNAGTAQLVHAYDTPWRTDTIEIPLTDFLGGANGSELEYKVAMKTGATLIYSWEVIGAKRPDDFHYDFHGHTLDKRDMQVATYKQSYGLKAQGALTAPFDGIEGWQFSNSSDDNLIVRLKLAGFYELIPGGEEGNLAGIVANVPATQARPGFKRPQ